KASLSSFSETGSEELSLALDGTHLRSTIASISTFFEKSFYNSDLPLTIYADIAIKQEFENSKILSTATFSGAPDDAFIYQLANRRNTYGQISINISKVISNSTNIAFSYAGEIANSHSNQNRKSVGIFTAF
ncbi:MAG: autotransporter outer membrane beta-barrel domain-containing protein, partial [Emcibacteraceae bacterium]|nr:autotransporter outer membrane beta-barrel domain-containing protein [Emcibacteraceae bacterium]